MSTLDEALRQFDATEANLVKLERLCQDIESLIPSGIDFSANPTYEHYCRAYEQIIAVLPLIDGWKPLAQPLDLNTIAQNRNDAVFIGEFSIELDMNRQIEAPARELRDYRFKFNQKRRQLIRDAITQIMVHVEQLLEVLVKRYDCTDDLGVKRRFPPFSIANICTKRRLQYVVN